MACALPLALLASATALAGQGSMQAEKDQGELTNDRLGAASVIYKGRSSFSGQHGGSFDHLPAARENLEVVSKFMPMSQGEVVPGQIADVAVHKNAAYLMSWARGEAEGTTCSKGGFYSVDISDPAAPRELAFVPAEFGTYHGEGAHAITMNTAHFQGDILGVNNEPCVAAGTGGFDLYDVSDPANPRPLVIAAGDTSTTDGGQRAKPNSSHSTFLWQAGDKAYAVIVDNVEFTDVDIFDITDPRNPVQIGDYDLVDMFPQIVGSSANGDSIFHHDMVVKEIDGRFIMLASYWDAGYVQLDVTDPTNPQLVGDTDFGETDPLTGKQPPEGNAHQGEYSFDNRYFLAADEDFSPFRFREFLMTTGPHQGQYNAGEFGWTKPIATLEDNTLNGPTIYGGYGCDASGTPHGGIPARSTAGYTLEPGEEAIVVVQRGPVGDPASPYPACTFQEKAENAAEAGYDAVLIANHHNGAQGGANPDAVLCGSGTGADIIGVCIGHRQFHLMFEDDPDYSSEYTSEPAIGTEGEKVQGTSEFDGWGYAHVFDRVTGAEIGAYAIEESLDERFAFGFGDLSIHEWATDPTEFIGYMAYYSGGIRVAEFGDFGIRETGKFIDVGGSNFWGIEQFNGPGNRERLIAGSDRDHGLYILRYTGPGAAQAPSCEDGFAFTPEGESVTVPLECSDPNTHNVLTREILDGPSNGTLEVKGDRAEYTPNAGFTGEDRFTFRASDGSLLSAPAQGRILVGRCSNVIDGTDGPDVITGTEFPDSIKSGAGDDVIAAAQGDDCVDGQDGNDEANGAQGADLLLGGAGNDRLFGDAGDDILDGQKGTDHLRGGSGDDRVRGAAGNDYLSGGSNDDFLIGGPGRDSIRGDSGNDRISGGAGNDAIDVGKGRNRVNAGAGNDRINAVNGQRDSISCGKGRDVVRADPKDRVGRSCEKVLRTTRTR
ncbi:MAG TPA: Ig-like domain-containing protein [Acidimicrobiia bacterium]|nr:Ig-like domain-containing protein [Acidimicrobiia bacterium]